VLPRTLPALPPALAERAAEVRWVQRMLPVSAGMERLETEAILSRLRWGDAEAPTELFWRYYERVRSRLCVVLGTPDAADDAVVTAFGRVLDAMDDGEHAGKPFEALLYQQVDSMRVPRPDDDGDEPAEDGAAPGPRARDARASVTGLRISGAELDEPVYVTARDPGWAGRARSERERLLRRLPGSVQAIEHIGGTAIPLVAARPVIDLLVGVDKMPVSKRMRAALLEAGYEACGPAGVPGRSFFRRRAPARRFDVHVLEQGCALWRDAIALRDYLSSHPTDARRWANAKQRAARESPESLMRYFELREPELDDILSRAAAAAAASAA
jgi:GrpB-like predicted nucleotidyltransferase (UPF0157 family)